MNSTTPEPPPGNELLAAIDATGAPATIKGKVQRAVLRFIAGGIGYEAWQEIRENLDTIEGRRRVNLILAEHVGRQALADPEIVERAKARFIGDLARKQDNIEAIARLANASADVSGEAGESVTDDTEEPSQDWMNVFIREAENASSDDLRERLAGVLAGEARKPGTFSRSTVRFIAEVDKETLEAFTEVLKSRIGDAIYVDESWASGLRFEQGMALESSGLMSGVTGMTHKVIKVSDEGHAILIGDKIGVAFVGEAGATNNLTCWLLTRLGTEVAALLPPHDEVVAASNLAKLAPKSGLSLIWTGPLILGSDGKPESVQPFLVVWDREADDDQSRR